jgi:hypothetical protein
MNELAEILCGAIWIAAAEGLNYPVFIFRAFMYSRLSSAAGAVLREQSFGVEASPVEIFLNVGDYHVPFAYEDSASGRQFKFFDERQAVQARPRHFASVYLNRIKDSNWRQIPGTRRVPFDTPENGFK